MNCRFGSQEKNLDGSSKVYQDLEDVFVINKEYIRDKKNLNKLPKELIDKLILYSSNKNDLVCDFFLGNFTTAYSALLLGRKICGFEINRQAYEYHMQRISQIKFGSEIPNVIDICPPNQGKPISDEDANNIYDEYKKLTTPNDLNTKIMFKKDAKKLLQNKYGRGPFSIKNIIDKIENIKKSK